LKPQGELTASERRVARLMVDAMDAVVAQVERDLTKIADAVAHSPAGKVADLVSVDPWYAVQEKLEEEFLAELLDAGSRVELPTLEKATLRYSFDRSRPESAAWARLRAAALVREITDEQRQTIRDVVAFGQESGLSPDDTARQMRQTVGLTQAQGGWVNNFRDRQITANINAGMGVSDAMRAAQGPTARYQSQIHGYRSRTIARTEIMSANSQGRQQAWGQGIQQGFISPNAMKEWIAEANACDICAPRNGTRQPVNKPWPGGEPPAHPNCRCDLLLIPTPVAIPRQNVGDLIASLASTILQSFAFPLADLLADVALLRLLRTLEDVNGRSDAIAERRDFYAGQGRPERAAVYDARSYQERTGLRSFSGTKRDSFSLSLDGEERRVKSVSRFSPSDEIRKIFEAADISVPDIFEVDPEESGLFHRLIADAKGSNKYGASVQLYEIEDYEDMRLFLTGDGGAGFALKDGDELVSVFRGNSNLKGIADLMVHLGIEQGARRADAFDTVLPYIYGDHGLSVVARTSWNDEFSPPGWEKSIFESFNNGEPDVVFMVYNPFDYLGYSAGMGRRFNKDEYDEAYEYAKLVLKWLNRRI
jgi:hypothetical protein